MTVFGLLDNYIPNPAPLEQRIYCCPDTARLIHGECRLPCASALLAEAELVLLLPANPKGELLAACGLDIGHPDWAAQDGQLWRAKGTSGFKLIGTPAPLVTLPPGATVRLNYQGRCRQRFPVHAWASDPDQVTDCLYRYGVLQRGDAVFMGTYPPAVPLAEGGQLQVTIDALPPLTATFTHRATGDLNVTVPPAGGLPTARPRR